MAGKRKNEDADESNHKDKQHRSLDAEDEGQGERERGDNGVQEDREPAGQEKTHQNEALAFLQSLEKERGLDGLVNIQEMIMLTKKHDYEQLCSEAMQTPPMAQQSVESKYFLISTDF